MNTHLATGLRELYERDEASRAFLDSLLARERNFRTTTVRRALAIVNQELEDVTRSEIIKTMRALEELGCGRFTPGRWQKPSRFEWELPMLSVGQLAVGEVAELDDEAVETEIYEEEEADIATLDHFFHLRPDFALELTLPADLSAGEAERLAQFVRSLPFEMSES